MTVPARLRVVAVTAVVAAAIALPAATSAAAPAAVPGSQPTMAPAVAGSVASNVPAGFLSALGSALAAAAPVSTPLIPAPTVANDPYSFCSNTDGVPYATGLPPLPCLVQRTLPRGATEPVPVEGAFSRWTDNGGLFTPVTQQVPRAGVVLNLPRTVGRIFQISCQTVRAAIPGTDQTFPTSPCPAGYGLQTPPPLNADGTPNYGYTGYFGLAGQVFVQSPLGASPQFGIIAQVKVNLLAFGSVPASAVVTVAQRFADGTSTPLKYSWGTIVSTVPQGTVITGYEEYGPAPYPDNEFGGSTNQVAQRLSITGPITITVSDVELDTVPLDVGSNCRTDTDLEVYARGGWIPPAALGLRAQRGEQGEYSVFYPPGYLHADLTVPAFTGCTGGGEDLSPLLTGFVSGAGNLLDLTQVTQLPTFSCLPVNASPDCFDEHVAVVDPNRIRPTVPAG